MKKIVIMILAALLLVSCATTEKSAKVYEYTETDVMIDAGDHKVPATITVPVVEEGVKLPAVVMLHGTGSNRHEAGNGYDYAAPEMAKAGIATIRFDYIGNGDSEEDYIDFTYDKALSDAEVCKSYIIENYPVDAERIGVMGWSLGGKLAFLAASRDPSFASVLTWAGAYGVYESQEEYEIAKKDGYYEMTFDWRDSLKESPEFYECAFAIDYPAEMARVTAPVLLIQGKADDTVLPETAEEIYASLTSSEKKDIFWIEGGDHTFGVFSGDDTVLKTAVAATIDWFKETL